MDQLTKEPVPKSALYLAVALAAGVLQAVLAPLPRAAIGLVTGEGPQSFYGPATVIDRYWFEPQWWWAGGGFAVALLISLGLARRVSAKILAVIVCVLVYVAIAFVGQEVTYPGNPFFGELMGHLSTVLFSDFTALLAAALAAVALFCFGRGARFDPARVRRELIPRV